MRLEASYSGLPQDPIGRKMQAALSARRLHTGFCGRIDAGDIRVLLKDRLKKMAPDFSRGEEFS